MRNAYIGNNIIIVSSSIGKHPDNGLYSKGPSYSGYSGYIMMPNMNNDPYMPNGSLSPPIPRTVSYLFQRLILASWLSSCLVCRACYNRVFWLASVTVKVELLLFIASVQWSLRALRGVGHNHSGKTEINVCEQGWGLCGGSSGLLL